MSLVSVAVPVPNLDLLTYAVPEGVAAPAIGARVLVPLGNRVVTGIVIDHLRDAGTARDLKFVQKVLDTEPFVPAEVVALARWTAEYYAAGVGDTIPALLPPMARGARVDAHKTQRIASITPAGLEAIRGGLAGADPRVGAEGGHMGPPLRKGQGALLEVLAAAPDGIPTLALAARGIAGSAIFRLVRHGYISVRSERLARDPFGVRPQPSAASSDAQNGGVRPQPSAASSDMQSSGVRPQPLAASSDAQSSGVRPQPSAASSDTQSSGVRPQPSAASSDAQNGGVRPQPSAASFDAPNGGVRPRGGEAPSRLLTGEQQAAFDRLRVLADSRAFHVALLHGVTGSGKTELYLRLATTTRDAGRRVLMLVPEIALTPAIAALFRDTFGDRVAIQHSGLSDGERHDQWHRIRRGEVDVVVGTRSAVFAPLETIGLIVVDEEHDGSYKQEDIPRYNARDVAIVRAQRAQALIVLGSATPSIETYHHAMTGKYERVVLERRVLDRPLADVKIVDMREEYAAEGPDVILSRPLRNAIQIRLERGEQSLVLLNRRGFATAVFCRQCAGTVDCPNCSVSLVVHGEGNARRARCHYCNYTARVPKICPLCAGPYLDQQGVGTERVEAEVKALAPSARVARLDRDAIRRRGALASLLERFRAGEIDVLVGTQMIAKGHDFPQVTLVGVVSADVGLGLADFRASERTFQLLTQVAGRAGRGDKLGEAIIQTLYPGHYSIQLACTQDYPSFYERELHFRRAMRYPPFVSLVNTVVRARAFSQAMDDAADLVQRVRDADARGDFRVLGPAPPPLGKLRGEYRAQVLVKGTNRKGIRLALQAALAGRPDVQRRAVVDIDPLSVV